MQTRRMAAYGTGNTFPPSPIHFLTAFHMAGGTGMLEGQLGGPMPSADLGAGVRQRNVVIGELLSMPYCMFGVV
jgi:hypothetical protein